MGPLKPDRLPPIFFYIWRMARIKLEIPQSLPFACQMPIRVTDLNYADHLANDKLLGLMHEARCRYLAHYGYTELNTEGVSFIMGDVAISFKHEGFQGQLLEIQVGVGDYTRVAFDMYYRIVILESGKTLAEAKTGLICFDYDSRKVRSVPTALRETLGDALAPIPN